MGFPIDADGLTTNYSLIKPYIGKNVWYQDYYDTMDIIDDQMKTNADAIATNLSSINALDGKIYSIGSSGGHVADHEHDGGDELDLTDLSGGIIYMDQINVDDIEENFPGSGVTIDSVLVKDGQITVVGDPVLDLQVATKQYVDTIVNGLDWQESVISFLDMTTAEPVAPSVGDRYINTVTGTSDQTAQAVTIDYIYEWNGTDWTEIVPDDGFACFNENDNLGYLYNSGSWGTFSSITTHNALTGLQGGQATEYYHLTATEHTNLIPIGATSELADWLDNVVLDTDGGIHLEDDAKINFGDSDYGYIKYDSALDYIELISDTMWFADSNWYLGIGIDEDGHSSGGPRNMEFWVYDSTNTIMNQIRLQGGTDLSTIFNHVNVDVDFIINKDTSGEAFVYDAGLDEIIIGSDIDFTDVLLKDDYITGGLTLSQSGDTDLNDWYTRTSIVGALNQLAENKFPANYRKHLIHYYDFLGNDPTNWSDLGSGNASIDWDIQIDGIFGGYSLQIDATGGAGDYFKASRENQGFGEIKLGQGTYSLEMIIKIGAVLPASPNNDYWVMIGLTDVRNAPLTQNDGCYFYFDYLDTNFQCTTEASNALTTTDSGITPVVDTGYVLRVDVNAGATEVKFYINDSLVATHTTTIPTAYLGLYSAIYANTNHNAIRNFYVDSFYESLILTTPR